MQYNLIEQNENFYTNYAMVVSDEFNSHIERCKNEITQRVQVKYKDFFAKNNDYKLEVEIKYPINQTQINKVIWFELYAVNKDGIRVADFTDFKKYKK